MAQSCLIGALAARFHKPHLEWPARIVSTNIGDRSVTLITPSQASIFAVGNWVNINSVEMQGQDGYPTNWYNHEYHQITGIRGGVISLDTPIKYRHLSTYPQTGYNSLGQVIALFDDLDSVASGLRWQS
jgi:hypothetical protein